jgi:acyl-CoA synthetase
MPNNCCFVCALDGTYGMVCAKSGATVWRGKLDSPIFADPVYLQPHKLVLMAEVAGVVHCVDLDGKKVIKSLENSCGCLCIKIAFFFQVWTFAASGNIFSSFELFDTETSVVNIIFGCHDKHLYSLLLDVLATNASLKWRLPFDSQIYATPRTFESSLIVCLTNGTILLVDRNTGDRLGRFRVEGEVFSTPAIWNRRVFVGCRDNNLYCLSCESPKKA